MNKISNQKDTSLLDHLT